MKFHYYAKTKLRTSESINILDNYFFVCVCASVRACVRACVRVCLPACMCVCVYNRSSHTCLQKRAIWARFKFYKTKTIPVINSRVDARANRVGRNVSNVPSDMCPQRRLPSAGVSAQSDQSLTSIWGKIWLIPATMSPLIVTYT